MLRPLTEADRSALAMFTCARPGEPWAEAVQEVVRNDLADQISTGSIGGVGLFTEAGTLCGVAAWRIYNVTEPALCRGDLVAVSIRAQRKGYGRQLKAAMIEAAQSAGAAAIASIVHRGNIGMLRLNEAMGAVIEAIPEEPEHVRCIITIPTD